MAKIEAFQFPSYQIYNSLIRQGVEVCVRAPAIKDKLKTLNFRSFSVEQQLCGSWAVVFSETIIVCKHSWVATDDACLKKRTSKKEQITSILKLTPKKSAAWLSKQFPKWEQDNLQRIKTLLLLNLGSVQLHCVSDPKNEAELKCLLCHCQGQWLLL